MSLRWVESLPHCDVAGLVYVCGGFPQSAGILYATGQRVTCNVFIRFAPGQRLLAVLGQHLTRRQQLLRQRKRTQEGRKVLEYSQKGAKGAGAAVYGKQKSRSGIFVVWLYTHIARITVQDEKGPRNSAVLVYFI